MDARKVVDRVHDGKIALNHAGSMVESCEYTIAKIKRGEEIEYEKGKSAQELQKAREQRPSKSWSATRPSRSPQRNRT
ncbi:MAG: hypothetical protein R3C56_35640 [Pirellulaceae bacterium]